MPTRASAGRTDVGSELRAARVSKGLSIQQVAEVTRISARALEALENNDASRLPGGIFSRAFVRSYADHVGLDPDTAVQRFLQQFPDDSPAEEQGLVAWQAHDAAQWRASRSPMVMGLAAVAVIAALVAAVVAYWLLGSAVPAEVRRGESSPPSSSSAAAMAPAAASLEPDTRGGAEIDVTSPVVGTPLGDARETGLRAAAGDPHGAPPPDPVLAGPAPAAPPPAAPTPPQALEVVIEPVATCWVRLMVDGQFAFARVLRPGEREVRTANDQVVFDIGDAAAFRFSINGVPGRVLGRKGQVVTARISRENVSSFLTQ